MECLRPSPPIEPTSRVDGGTRPVGGSVSSALPLSWRSETLGGGTTVLVALEGELDRFTTPSLRDHLRWHLANGCRRLVLDAGSITSADRAAHDLLCDVGRRAIDCRCTVVAASPGPAIRRLLDVLGTPAGVTRED